MVRPKELLLTLRFVDVVLPQTSIAVSAKEFVALARGRFSAENVPPRCTRAGKALVTPFVPTMHSVICAVVLSTFPCTLKVVPHKLTPAWGQVMVRVGGVLLLTRVMLKVVVVECPAISVAWRLIAFSPAERPTSKA